MELLKINVFAVIVLSSLMLISCNKESQKTEINIRETNVSLTKEEALQQFASILSMAASNEHALRSFLKEEALKKYDKDYDVFYPWCKDKNVTPGKTLQELLIDYSDERTLHLIEQTVPRMTIYIPDWSWMGQDAFSINRWDVSKNDVVTSYYDKKAEKKLYHNGEEIKTLEMDDFLCTPILIVKDNDKMTIQKSDTKSTVYEYDFADEVFNGIKTKGHGTVHEYFDLGSYTETEAESLSALTGRVGNAYNEASLNYNMCQRDYVYYNMTAAIDSGWVDFHYKERITKIRLNVFAEGLFYNSTTHDEAGDYSLVTYEISPSATPGVNINRTWLTLEQIMQMAWGQGTITLKAHVIYGNAEICKVVSIPFHQAFHVNMVEQVREENWLGATMWRQYFTKQEYLTSKWIPVNWDLFCWDLRDIPSKILIKFEEYDNSSYTTTETVNHVFEFAKNFKTSTEINASGTIQLVQLGLKLGHEYGDTMKESVNSTVYYSINEDSDDLGSIEIEYKDPFISSINNDEARFYIYSTGTVDAVSRPVLIY